MSEPLDYPADPPTGPQTAVLPDGPHPHAPQGYAFRQGAPVAPPAFQANPPIPPNQAKPNRLNKVAAGVCIAAGSLVIIAVLFGGGFYLGRETAPVPRPDERSAARLEQGGPMIIPMPPRGQFDQPGPGIAIPNGPTIQLPNIFGPMPTFPSGPSTPTPGQPPR